MGNSPEPPDLPAAPTATNTYIYDESGNLSGSITKDAGGNSVYKPAQLTGAEKIRKDNIESTKASLLQRLYQTPAEYTKAAEEEAAAYASRATEAQRKSFTEDVNRIGEVSNTRGLMGSSAWRDIIKSREETQSKTAADIALNATSMRESLIGAKKSQDYNLYNLYSGASNDYSNKNASNYNMAMGLATKSSNDAMNQWKGTVDALNTDYTNRMAYSQANDPWRNYILPTATAAAMVPWCDRRLKKNIIPLFKVGEVQWYEFEYNPEVWPEGIIKPPAGKHIGVMADEVRDIPGVVETEGFYGFDMVNYDVLRRHLNMENA